MALEQTFQRHTGIIRQSVEGGWGRRKIWRSGLCQGESDETAFTEPRTWLGQGDPESLECPPGEFGLYLVDSGVMEQGDDLFVAQSVLSLLPCSVRADAFLRFSRDRKPSLCSLVPFLRSRLTPSPRIRALFLVFCSAALACSPYLLWLSIHFLSLAQTHVPWDWGRLDLNLRGVGYEHGVTTQ